MMKKDWFMNKNVLVIVIIIVVAVALAAGFYLRNKQPQEPITPTTPVVEVEKSEGLGSEISGQIQQNPVENIPQTNPFEAETNPFGETQVNPFEDVYKNPFE